VAQRTTLPGLPAGGNRGGLVQAAVTAKRGNGFQQGRKVFRRKWQWRINLESG
jgi:hypothetical protein